MADRAVPSNQRAITPGHSPCHPCAALARRFDLSRSATAIFQFFLYELCDKYVESVKVPLRALLPHLALPSFPYDVCHAATPLSPASSASLCTPHSLCSFHPFACALSRFQTYRAGCASHGITPRGLALTRPTTFSLSSNGAGGTTHAHRSTASKQTRTTLAIVSEVHRFATSRLSGHLLASRSLPHPRRTRPYSRPCRCSTCSCMSSSRASAWRTPSSPS